MTTTAAARPQRRQLPPPITGIVRRTEQLSPGMVRVVLGGEDLARFAMNEFSDAYVKLVFLRPGVEYPRPLDLNAIRAQLPPEHWPQQRTYTVRAWDAAALELTVDFVVHGDEGVAGPWARAAKPGDDVLVLGPGGGYRPGPGAALHLLVGDESALPAIAASLEQLPADARGYVLLEVEDGTHEQTLARPDGVEVRWLHRGDRPLGTGLVEAVRALDLPVEGLRGFVHGEAGVVRDLRRLLRQERGVPLSALSISGYWRVGQDDEAWRSVKRDWNQAIEAAEAS
jgi:NADPH-dependent ferric siderophore reductase